VSAPRGPERDDPTAEARRRLMRNAMLYSYGAIASAVLLAIGGAALVALLLRGTGWPFLRTWLVLAGLVLLPPLLWALWGSLRGRSRH
jgi:hypothetical protein